MHLGNSRIHLGRLYSQVFENSPLQVLLAGKGAPCRTSWLTFSAGSITAEN
jgi:hypothetical protein